MKYHSFDNYHEQIAVTKGAIGGHCSSKTFPGIFTRLDAEENFNWLQKVIYGIEPTSATTTTTTTTPSTTTRVTEPTGSSHKILVTTGAGGRGQTTKIIDPKNDDFTCNLPEYPKDISDGVGGIVEDTIPFICGGYSHGSWLRKCYKLINKIWQPAGMLEPLRSSMGNGNVVIDKQLLLSGGKASDGSLTDQTSLMDTISKMKLNDMPKGIMGHCIVKLGQSKIILIGGVDDYNGLTSETLIFDLENKQWSEGPRMRQRRWLHGCVSSNLDGKPIIWVTGGNDDVSSLQSTEYLEDFDQGWKSGTFPIILQV